MCRILYEVEGGFYLKEDKINDDCFLSDAIDAKTLIKSHWNYHESELKNVIEVNNPNFAYQDYFEFSLNNSINIEKEYWNSYSHPIFGSYLFSDEDKDL